MEVVCPTVECLEAVLSSHGRPIGIDPLASHVSEPILEHGYWSSAQDRLPIAQIDELTHGDIVTPPSRIWERQCMPTLARARQPVTDPFRSGHPGSDLLSR
ncbi:hypothetical protein DOZ80_10280 [Pseudomonas fluorescens]|uniref:Uncharacterized protein n=1 Tax=Pseudomonas fluorescens TaxID=294 RepID=A0A327NE46_PSEFL|nr:hypothetical protein DOZ80_10280 [Pseudomonas fluorescens]